MSSVNFLEKLLDGVEVEWKTLGDVATIQRGASPRPIQEYLTDDTDAIPWIKIGDTSLDCKYIDKTLQRITKEGAKKSRLLNKGDLILSNSMSYGRPYILGIDGAIHDGWASIGDFQELYVSDFLYYYLSSSNVKAYWDSKINSSSVSNLNSEIIKSLPIPIIFPANPKKSIEIQAEIVRILDAMTAHTAELTAELTARKKQYNYYRDKLLSFEGGEVEWKTLGAMTRISSASRVHKNQWTPSGVPFFRTSDVISIFNGVKNSRDDAFISHELYEELSLKSGKTEAGDILVTGGGTIGIPYIVPNNEPLYYKDADLLCIKKLKEINSKFLYHYFLSTQFRVYLEKISHNSTIAHYTISQIEKTPVPVPSLDEQNRIVTLLDKFDALTASITEGLPREIELREKQYAYYRDLLLSFPQAQAA